MKSNICMILAVVGSVSIVMTSLAGCNNKSTDIKTEASSNNKPTTIKTTVNSNKITPKEIVKEITSEEYRGRLIGTEGNKKTVEYLKGVMEKIGLEPYEGSYLMEYDHDTADPSEQNTSVTIVFKDNSERELVYGKDYYTNITPYDIDMERELEFDESKASKEKILVADSSFINFDSTGDVLIVISDVPHCNMGLKNGTTFFRISINSKLANELKSKGTVKARVKTTCVQKADKLNNVLGVIKAKNPTDKAVVLTAHLDHMGKQGDFLFNGVVDNASGVAAMLDAANKIKLENKETDYDIIVAAVNSEEVHDRGSRLVGSKTLRNVLSQKYKYLININTDSVGTPFPMEIEYMNKQSEKISEMFLNELKNNNIEYINESAGASDYASFSNTYPTIALSQYGNRKDLQEKEKLDYHGIGLTYEYLDYDLMDRISNLIKNVALNAENCFDIEPAHAEKLSLKLNEAVYQKEVNDIYLVTASLDNSIEDFKEIDSLFTDHKFSQKIDKYVFKSVQFTINGVTEKEKIQTSKEHERLMTASPKNEYIRNKKYFVLDDTSNLTYNVPFKFAENFTISDISCAFFMYENPDIKDCYMYLNIVPIIPGYNDDYSDTTKYTSIAERGYENIYLSFSEKGICTICRVSKDKATWTDFTPAAYDFDVKTADKETLIKAAIEKIELFNLDQDII